MKRIFTFLVLFFIFLVDVNAQNTSNEGTDFWVCFPSHVPAGTQNNPQLATLSVFITSKSNTSGVVSCGGFSQNFSVQANTVTEVLVPRFDSYITDGTGIYSNKGIRILIDAGKPKAVVYAHVFAGARSAATLVLPVLALGQKYYGISYDQSSIGKSQIDMVCVEANTTLLITPRLDGVLQNTFPVTLSNVGDVYQYQSDRDISGTYVEVDPTNSSCKRFAAFSGSSALAILSPGCYPPGGSLNRNISYDPLFQQLYPLESWGQTFPLIPFADRNTGSIFRVLASENNTKVNIAGVSVTLNAGAFYETLPINKVSLITADKPVTVTQYAITQYCADSRNAGNNVSPSDPDMVIINPLEYSIKNVTMYSSNKLAIRDQYLNIIIPNTGLPSFKINGANFANRFSAVPGSSTYSYAQIYLTQIGGSNFNLTADVGFNAIAYGFGDYESYAYSAGTNLASSVFINAVRPATNEVINNACTDEDFDFKLVLPYISQKLIWSLEAGDPPIIQNAPLNPTMIVINGKVLFEYRLPVNKNYNTVGTKKIKIISTLPPSSGGCPTGDETLNFDFEVYDPPATTSFRSQDTACVNNPVQFNLDENNNSRPIINYYWDFGDGTFSSDKNPSHVFSSTGQKTVSLYVKNDVACLSNVYQLPIEVLDQPAVDFSIAAALCAQKPIQFTNHSNLEGNAISGYLWDFNDGTTSTEENPVHSFDTKGNYTVSLTIKTIAQCVVTQSKSVMVNSSPTADFDDPQACVSDNVIFNTKDESDDIVSYQWDFGDGVVDAAQNTRKNPSHRYNASGLYTVKLSVTSSTGCVTEVNKAITISAADPESKFTVVSPESLCSNLPVQFQDLSSVSFGKITKLEWIYDYSSSGMNAKEVFNDPVTNAIYEHKYPASKDTKNYQVVLRAYSGTICFQDFGPVTITVKGSPEVKFDPLTNVCLNTASFSLTQASELTGIPGSGIFSGPGVDENGVFDPSLSGVGDFDITYTFMANDGCSDSKIQRITVFPLPVVDAGEDVVILSGGQATLRAQATGAGLTYKWFPSEGLDKDDVLKPLASPKTSTLYTLLATSSDGCITSDVVNVIVAGLPQIPNTFTPNSDGVNDTWNIKYLDTYVNAKVTIFNRYGNEVFSSIGYPAPWDGRSNGKDVPMGVYYYVIDPRNGNEKISGSVTVIR